ncbi:GntR family transcriptional regulator [Rhodococcus koreensis]|uniref:GntR family transcriptional regulator n=1 Tax=Rhodococcus sp. T2V TaxID=3034164 RepID=UPI0023E2354D|nr:GntR family transcriptional regulator [Rhodococcus sp. T2V]MDF3307289.1 GntR family transcriptional regulator [Rhodococcus sp. T2V]
MTTSTEGSIDRQSVVPYYQQLASVLEGRISSGAIARGAKLPSENELSVQFELSRATVRQALQFLESRGVAQRIPNRGVFASAPKDGTGWVIQGKEGFLENAMGHQNRSVSTRVLRSGTATFPDHVCQALNLPSETVGFELVRVRSLDGTPALFSTNYSPPILTPVLASASEVLAGEASLTTLLTNAGFSLGGANRIIRAARPTPEIAEALAIDADEPMLCIRSTSWTPEGLRYDVYETWVRSDIIPLEVDVSTVDLGNVAR